MSHSLQKFDLSIYYGDTDAGGVIYHARYLEFFERAYYEFLRGCGFDIAALAATGVIFAVVNLEVDYKIPGKLGDRVQVQTQLLELGKVTMILQQELWRPEDNTMLSHAKVRRGCISQQGRPTAIPKDLYNSLAKYL